VSAYLKAYRVFVDGDPMMPGAAGAITASTLVMTGELDPGSTPAMSRDIASVVPRGRSRILSGLRHVPPIEAPGECVDALLEFLDEPTSH
ncbi:MAG: alpha/beta hydrolase, partial [Acidimicrobiales bacterium]|nr:alpha/beta hydrolase [Acidimicrobiales bacterium]